MASPWVRVGRLGHSISTSLTDGVSLPPRGLPFIRPGQLHRGDARRGQLRQAIAVPRVKITSSGSLLDQTPILSLSG
jgi:hypothetical protein